MEMEARKEVQHDKKWGLHVKKLNMEGCTQELATVGVQESARRTGGREPPTV
jgi:hypothetical protein